MLVRVVVSHMCMYSIILQESVVTQFVSVHQLFMKKIFAGTI